MRQDSIRLLKARIWDQSAFLFYLLLVAESNRLLVIFYSLQKTRTLYFGVLAAGAPDIAGGFDAVAIGVGLGRL